VTAPAELAELEFDSLEVGMQVEEEVAWTQEQFDAFRSLTGDEAPVHRDAEFAVDVGMPAPIVYGLLVGSPFSRMLGCRLPGTLSVIQSLRFEFAQPTLWNEPLVYRASITQLSRAIRSVVLELSVSRPDGTVLVRGRAQCGLAR
jgi:3-hydroxybutyryl-CoA dehydratase